MNEKRKKAIRKRRIFIASTSLVLIAAIVGVVFGVIAIVKAVKSGDDSEKSSSGIVQTEAKKADVKKETDPAFDNTEQLVTIGGVQLDANYKNLLLVNGSNPLPDNYDYTAELTTIPKEYHNGQLDQINKNI